MVCTNDASAPAPSAATSSNAVATQMGPPPATVHQATHSRSIEGIGSMVAVAAGATPSGTSVTVDALGASTATVTPAGARPGCASGNTANKVSPVPRTLSFTAMTPVTAQPSECASALMALVSVQSDVQVGPMTSLISRAPPSKPALLCGSSSDASTASQHLVARDAEFEGEIDIGL
jgi:hypothetical protein